MSMAKRLSDEQKKFRLLSEKQYQKQITDLASIYGWRWVHFADSRKQVKPGVFVGDKESAGFPDLLLLRPPEMVVVEVKRETGKTTEIQEEWLKDFRGCGVDAFVSRPSNFEEIMSRLTRARVV